MSLHIIFYTLLFKNHGYVPDFILIHNSPGLHINIEIDEPYTLKGKPIHIYDQARNKYFLEKKWIVIRFSEEQVVNNPDSCCKVIAGVINLTTADHTYIDLFKNVIDLPETKKWNTEEAIRMFNLNFRNTYLKKLTSKV